ncbi:hypothetical protein, partial [Mycobacterium avium]|uniref:hypothetical protein n=1 Tax=Mycobacterium avium TaxID=1764 RepID=UPI00266665C9
MDGVSTSADLPTVEWFTRLAEVSKADLAEFRKLGEVDCRFAVNIFDGSRPETGVNGAGRRFCFETYQVIEERTYARACSSIADRSRSR